MVGVFTTKNSHWQKGAKNNPKKLRTFGFGKNNRETASLPSGKNGSFSIFGAGIMMVGFLIFSGAFYLFQVNDLATKGYEIKEIENQIQNLEKDGKKMKIKEVELRSMYNIEKATENFDLVSPNEITYLELDGPVAMK